MKNYINISMIYAIFALVSGVFYREFPNSMTLQERLHSLSPTYTSMHWVCCSFSSSPSW